MPYVLAAVATLLAALVVRHMNGRKAPILIGIAVAVLICGTLAEVRHRHTDHRLSEATNVLLARDDTTIVCERLSSAMLNVWNRAGYVQWTPDGSKPRRADLAWDTCRNLQEWMRSSRGAEDLDHVIAVHVLTHEAMHLDGRYNEADAECAAMQADARMARILGATEIEARALAQTYWREVYPSMPDAYRSNDCADGAAWDRTPADGEWP